MAVKAKITGLDDLKKAFDRLSKDIQGQTLQTAVRVGSLPIQNSAIEKCPVLTGNLRRSIHTEVEGSNTYAQADVGTDVVYAPYVEFGTKRQAAQPYLRPALDENKDNAVREISNVLKELLK